MRRVVVFPHPDGPSIAKNSPRAMAKSASCTATKSPKRLDTWRNSMTSSGRLVGRGSVRSLPPVPGRLAPQQAAKRNLADRARLCKRIHAVCTVGRRNRLRGHLAATQHDGHVQVSRSSAIARPSRPLKGRCRGRTRTSSAASGCAARDGRTDDVVNPATGEVIATVTSSDAADVDAAVDAGGRRVRGVVVDDAAPSCRGAAPGRAGGRRRRRHAERDRDAQRRQAPLDHRGRDGPQRRQPPLLRLRGPVPRRPRGRRVPRGPHLVRAPRPARRRRRHRAVELPAQHGGVEARSRAGRRQHDGAEAVGAHAAVDPAVRGDHGRHPSARRVQRRARTGRDRGRRAREPSEDRARVAHGRRRDRQDHRRAPRPTR